MDVKSTNFYNELNKIVINRCPIIVNQIKNHFKRIKDFRKYGIFAQYDFHPWEQIIEWTIEVDFRKDGCAEITGKPYYYGSFISIEIVKGLNTAYCNFGKISESFSGAEHKRKDKIEVIQIDELDLPHNILNMTSKINGFLDSLAENFITELIIIQKKNLLP